MQKRKKNMEALVADRHGSLVKQIARKIAKDPPRLAYPGAAVLENLARVVVAEGLRDELKARANLEREDRLSGRAAALLGAHDSVSSRPCCCTCLSQRRQRVLSLVRP
jgi:hypothetical protein